MIMSDRRNRPPNQWGCKPFEDICVAHDDVLVCRHGCELVKQHKCNSGYPGMCPVKIEDGLLCGLAKGHNGECQP